MASQDTSVATQRMKNASAIVGEVAIIKVSGRDCIIDAEDYDKVSAAAAAISWFVKSDLRDGNKRVIMKRDGKEIPLRRIVTGATADMVIFHRSGDTLDCRKSNLKILVKPTYPDTPVVRPEIPAGAALIPLARSFAIVDKSDLPLLRKFHWRDAAGYVCTTKGRREIRMHRLLMNPADHEVIDHVNGNPLDNRRANLRKCSDRENARNAKKYSRSSAPYKGISRRKEGDYRAQICVNRLKVNLGNYPTPEAAAKAYDDAACKIFGEFARPNFPFEISR